MATVYLATDVRHERQVAVKVLRPDLSASIGSERFLQEIRIAARLAHPHILPLHDSGAAGGFLYYVMPYVRGESLRQRLAREGELPVSDASRILRDVADALAHAHEHGVVHRDIKPENILLSGRHALVADFGVAKAVSEATGRSQLTTAGVALGTPAYMAPEQAAADPHVDHRADIYALGVVGYEMFAGEPPFTGNSPQQVLASHMTERPRPLSARRAVMPPLLADALMRCLEKRPADRWQSAGELLAQIEALATPTGGSTPTHTQPVPAVAPLRRRAPVIAAAAAILALVAVAGIWGGRAFPEKAAGPAVLLRERTQLTFTGRVKLPAISPDGKQLAFVTKECSEAACAYAVEVQDVGGTATRRVLEGAASAYFIEWSPDRRHLLVTGTIDRRWGTHLVSLLGGAPRRIGIGGAMGGSGAAFFAGGDSLLIAPPANSDSTQWIAVTTLAGAVRDSIRIATGGRRTMSINTIPGTGWIVVGFVDPPAMEHVVIDRQGRPAGRATGGYSIGQASVDAFWRSSDLSDGRARGRASIVRTGFDAATGRLSAGVDTVYTGRFTGFSVTADGGALVIDEGSYQHSIYALELSDALAGRFPEARRILQGSTPITAQISPDGRRVLLQRVVVSASGAPDYAMSLQPFEGGPESPLNVPAGTDQVFWDDSVTLVVRSRSPQGLKFSLLDLRTGERRQEFTAPDSIIWDLDVVPGGWIWIPDGGEQLNVHQAGRTRTIPKPAWYEIVNEVSASSARVAFNGWNAGTEDTMRLSELSLPDGRSVPWLSRFVDHGSFRVHNDGSMIFAAYETEETAELLHVTAPGVTRRLGVIPRPINGVSVSEDLRRVVVATRDYFGDVWMTRVERR